MYRGLYIPDSERFPAHFRGLGIRIEDSVCIQEEHPYVLTTEAVKEVRRVLDECCTTGSDEHNQIFFADMINRLPTLKP